MIAGNSWNCNFGQIIKIRLEFCNFGQIIKIRLEYLKPCTRVQIISITLEYLQREIPINL